MLQSDTGQKGLQPDASFVGLPCTGRLDASACEANDSPLSFPGSFEHVSFFLPAAVGYFFSYPLPMFAALATAQYCFSVVCIFECSSKACEVRYFGRPSLIFASGKTRRRHTNLLQSIATLVCARSVMVQLVGARGVSATKLRTR